jgi:hypothetical protein
LLIIGLREIGLKLESISLGGENFWIGVIFAAFYIDGTNSSQTDELKMEHKG